MNRLATFFVLFLILSLAGTAAPALAADAPAAFAITNARIFDGTRMLGKGTVVVRDGKIAAAGPDVKAPAGATVIDAAGGTVIPGLMDCHTHTFLLDMLQRALVFGVTTELDMFTAPAFAQAMREEQARPGGAPAGLDPKALFGLFVGAGPAPGPFRFQIDDVRLVPAESSP